MPLSPGARLGDYEIRQPVDAGGMGEVYLARDVKLGREVAVKVLKGDLRPHPDRIRRFEQEARAASALSHPNVCVVHALGETAQGQPFIAMEYIEGQTLRKLLQTDPPALKAALDIAIQVAAGTGAAHAIGIVHRDLKPENVIVRGDGLVKVLDFGLAKLTSEDLPGDEATRSLVKTADGVVMGTFTYMSPEQARGKEVDARTDVWALGVMLYELVSGRVPFTGESRSDVIVSILDREPAPLDKLNPAIPHELQRIVAKALRKDRAQRYQTIADLRLDLESLRTDLQSSSQGTAPAAVPLQAAQTPQPGRRESSAEYILTGIGRHKLAALGALLAIVAGAGAAWRLARGSTEGPAAEVSAVQRSLTRLTFGAGLQTDPTLSPDGRFLAYASDRAGNFDIWVQPVAGGDAVQVTKGPDSETQPAWSPDGSTIVFRSEKGGGGLFVIPALGGPSRRLTTAGERPAWSHDGTEVLYQVGGFVNSTIGYVRLYAVPAGGGPSRELAAPVLEHGMWWWVAEHPDGRLSAAGMHETLGTGFFTFSRSGDHLIKSDTSAIRELLSTAPYRFRFVWNRTGSRLYIEASVTVDNLWRVDVEPDTMRWRSAERLTTGGGSDVDAVLSADDHRLVYVQQASSGRLWSFPFDAALGRLTGEGHPFSEAAGTANSSDLSQDGSAVVYELVHTGSDEVDLWRYDFDSGAARLVVPNAFGPVWCSDGRSLVHGRTQQDRWTIIRREPDGTERQLTPWMNRPLLNLQPVPRAPAILVTAFGSDSSPIWQLNVDRYNDTPERVVLEQPHVNIWQARVSPNGRWLAFVPEAIGQSDSMGVHLAKFGDGPSTAWTAAVPGLAITDKPRWSPDGRVLYFLSNEAGFLNLFGIRFDPDRGTAVGRPFQVTHFNSPDLIVSRHLDRTETGIAAHRLVLTMESSTGSIWMLDNVDK